MALFARRRWVAFNLGALSLFIIGCTVPKATPLQPVDSFELTGTGAGARGVRVRMNASERDAQALPDASDWDSVTFTLGASPSQLVTDLNTTLAKSALIIGGNSAGSGTTLFSNVRPGVYHLFASTYLGTVRSAMGYAPVTLSPNAVANATILLQTIPVWPAATLAGVGGAGDGGDGVAAATAFLNDPAGLSLGSDGSLYFTEYGYNRVRKIEGPFAAGATLSTVVSGISNPGPTAFDTLAGGLYVGSSGDGKIRFVSGLPSTPVLDAWELSATSPGALCFDATLNRLFVVSGNQVLVVNNPRTGAQSVQVLVGSGGLVSGVTLDAPQGLAFDSAAGVLYVADTGNRRILSINLTGYAVTTVAGTGTDASSGDGSLAASASFKVPTSLAFDSTDPEGRLYVSDSAAAVVRVVTLGKTTGRRMIATVFGNGQQQSQNATYAQQASLTEPQSLVFYNSVASASLFVADGNLIRSALR